jgi:hypothetical protein
MRFVFMCPPPPKKKALLCLSVEEKIELGLKGIVYTNNKG